MSYQRLKAKAVLVVVLLLSVLCANYDAGPVAQAIRPASPLPEWVSITQAGNCAVGCWRLVGVEYLNEQEGGGLHHVFVKTLDQSGAQISDVPWFVEYATGRDELRSKPSPDWSDDALWACFFPDQGQVGPYSVYVADAARSDRVAGLGLPYCHHESIRLVYQWVVGAVPTVTATLSPSATPTATVVPCGACNRRLYLPVVTR